MERVGTLLQKLQEQFASHAPAEQLLLTVQQLNAELMHLQRSGLNNRAISVDIATVVNQPPHQYQVTQTPAVTAPQPEEKIIEVLQIDEAEVEAELEEIKRKSEELQRMSVHNKPVVIFETEEEIPTLAHQQNKQLVKEVKEINDAAAEQHLSINDKLKQGTMELGDQLVEAPIRDLRKAIGVNDRFLYIKELFRGDEVMYERSIKTINGFSILPEAEYWIQRELKVKLGWNDNSEILRQFIQLVKRRFT